MTGPELLQIRASAGSGKTYELTRRYMARLASLRPGSNASAARGILAITFTNAAANEMRERVIRQLKGAVLGGAASPVDAKSASFWLDVFLEDPSALNIRTIDSLLHQIIRASALDLGISPDYETAFDTDEVLKPYVDRFLEHAAADSRASSDLRAACRALLEGSKTGSFSGGGLILRRISDVMELALRGKLENMASPEKITELEKNSQKNVADTASKLLSLADAAGLEWNKRARDAIQKLADGIAVKSSEYYVKSEAKYLFNKKPDISPEIEKAYASVREAAQNHFQAMEILAQGKLWAGCTAMASRIAALFMEDMAKAAVLPQILASMKAKSVLSPLGAVSEAFCRMGNRLKHFLVDEFQDTSSDQWAVLQSLALEGLARGGSFLWVGDPKQSIYGWRGGKPELFSAVGDNPELRAVCPELQTRRLECNWRSGIDIVRHTNQFFAPLANPKQAADIVRSMLSAGFNENVLAKCAELIAETYRDVNQEYQSPDNAYVCVENVKAPTRDDLRALVLEKLRTLLLDDIGYRRGWSDVLILTRDNVFARETAEVLGAANIPVLTENGLLLNENAIVLETIAFLTFLNNPRDDLAFWATLNGEIVLGHPDAAEITPANLADLAAERGQEHLFQTFMASYPDIWKKLFAPFYNQASILTAYDTVMEWYKRLDVAARFPADATMLRRLLETLHLAENDGMTSLASFLDYWKEHSVDEKAPMPQNMNAVRIMTIHKAKGLEAPVVIVPCTDFSIKPSEKPQIFTIASQKIAARFRSGMGQLYHEEMGRQALEALNLLYVAMTRPVEELYIFNTCAESGSSNNTSGAIRKLAEQAGFPLSYTFGMKQNLQRQVQPDAKPQSLVPQAVDKGQEDWLPMQWLPRLKIFRNHTHTGELAANERGTLLHAALEQLTLRDDSESACKTALLAAERATGISAPPRARPGLLRALEWFAAIPQARQWLAKGLPEHCFMSENGKVIRADLIVPLSNGPLVIDYKSGGADPAHTAQIQNYLAALQQSAQFPGVPAGLLIYLDLRQFRQISIGKAFPLTDRLPESAASA